MRQRRNYQEWVAKADSDLEAAKVLFDQKKAYDIVCFHCQQAVEKYLKALLVFYGIRFEKIHDLWVLAQKIFPKEPNIKLFREKLRTLDAYYIGARYPGDIPEYSRNDAKEALARANEIIDFVRRIIH